MTKSEYQELVEFIAPQFDGINKRLEAVDGRFEAVDERFDAMDDRLRRVEVLWEDNRHQIRIVAEAVSANARTLEAFRSEVATGFQDLRELLVS
jgi:chromosome segregation ATPase